MSSAVNADRRVVLRRAAPQDAEVCGPICYAAFATLARQHGFDEDFPSPEVATMVLSGLLSNPGFYGVVAELEGRAVGSNFLDERSAIAGVGPISVDPDCQDSGVGKQLMRDVLDRAAQRRFPGVRLLQAAYHNRSLSLYAKLGFVVREPVLNVIGELPRARVSGREVRRAAGADSDACNTLCRAVHGHDRAGELAESIALGSAHLVEHDGRVTGYATGIGFFAHAVGETTDDLIVLIGAADGFVGPGFLVPARNSRLVSWCLGHGLRTRMVTTLMAIGLYNEPAGAYLPSILY
jgi:GNAT superfamily N-acetyltransferase